MLVAAENGELFFLNALAVNDIKRAQEYHRNKDENQQHDINKFFA